MIEECPNCANLYIARSDIEREMGQHELALLDIDKALELCPDNAEYHTLKAILYEKLGNKEAAQKSRNAAVSLKSRYGF